MNVPLTVDFSTVWESIDKGGTIALALLFIVAFIRGWIVPRWAYLELKERCSQLTTLADRATELADRQGLAGEELRRQLKEDRKERR